METLAAKRAKKKYRETHREVLHARARLKHESDPVGEMLRRARHRASRHGTPYSLSREDVSIPEICPVFNIPLVPSKGGKEDSSPSIDRIKPELGYVPGNVVVVSWKANKLKRAIGPEELLALSNFYRRYV